MVVCVSRWVAFLINLTVLSISRGYMIRRRSFLSVLSISQGYMIRRGSFLTVLRDPRLVLQTLFPDHLAGLLGWQLKKSHCVISVLARGDWINCCALWLKPSKYSARHVLSGDDLCQKWWQIALYWLALSMVDLCTWTHRIICVSRVVKRVRRLLDGIVNYRYLHLDRVHRIRVWNMRFCCCIVLHMAPS